MELLIAKLTVFLASPQAALLFAALWGLSEFLASFPAVQSNSVFQLVKNSIAWLMAKFPKA
jgi:hypothetical protein